VTWYPTGEEIEEKLIELAYAWGDIEELLELQALAEGEGEFVPAVARPAAVGKKRELSMAIGAAFRVEAQFGENDFADPCTFYVLLYDVTDPRGREAAAQVESDPLLRGMIATSPNPGTASTS